MDNSLFRGAALVATLFCGAGHAQTLVNQYCAGCHNDKLKSGGEDNDGAVDNPDKIVQFQVAADVEKQKSSG